MRSLATRLRNFCPPSGLSREARQLFWRWIIPQISMARKRAITGAETGGNTADLGFEAKLRPTAEQAAPAPHIEASAENMGGSMSSNQSGDCYARSARPNWATHSQGLGSQRDIRRALHPDLRAA
jgi:hypothetical protein